MTIDDPRTDPNNPSCFHNRSVTVTQSQWIYNGSSQSIKSSLTILANAFVSSNRTYQFMLRMSNKRNASQQVIGYVLVRVAETSPGTIIIGFDCYSFDFDSHLPFLLCSCVIQTMCIPNLEYQSVNPTTQVALYSFCLGNCPTFLNMTWNIYQGHTNHSSNITQWTLFPWIQLNENLWFFGIGDFIVNQTLRILSQ